MIAVSSVQYHHTTLNYHSAVVSPLPIIQHIIQYAPRVTLKDFFERTRQCLGNPCNHGKDNEDEVPEEAGRDSVGIVFEVGLEVAFLL